jgi:hypothetical protein
MESRHGQLIPCCVDELRPHPGYARHGITVSASKLSSLAESGDIVFREPLAITRDRTILDGYARWELARKQGRRTLHCLEYDLLEAEALHWLLLRHRRSNGLNDFCRILLAMELEPWLKEQARYNQHLGGQQKGSSNLTEADRLDVRSKIAAAAGVSTGNLNKARHLIATAHPLVQEALRSGEVNIHRASVWLRSPEKQLDQLRFHQSRRGITCKIDSLVQAHRRSAHNEDLEPQRVLSALHAMSPERKSAILVAVIEVQGELLLISPALRRFLTSQGEFQP